jgi:carbon-monoxide dehydrogenase medium subunit
MKLPQFEYASPSSLEEAIALLANNDGAKVLAGGQSLLPVMAFRLAYPSLLVDLRHIQGLDQITISEDGVRLGSKVRWCDIEANRDLRAAHPLVCEMIAHVAHFQIRNRGTVGGSLAHADPSAEMPGLAVVSDCDIVVRGSGGERIIAASDFFAGALETALAREEIIVEVRFPPWKPGRRWAFQEFARRRGDFAIVGVAAFFDLDAEERIVDAHVGVIGAADTPRRLPEVEQCLNGRMMTEDVIAQAKEAAQSAIKEPLQDIHAAADYRIALLGTLTARVLQSAMEARQP